MSKAAAYIEQEQDKIIHLDFPKAKPRRNLKDKLSVWAFALWITIGFSTIGYWLVEKVLP